jgi:hypothetical protein
VPLTDGGTGASDAATARTNLGLGTAAVKNTGASGNNVPLLDGANTWSGQQNLTAGFKESGSFLTRLEGAGSAVPSGCVGAGFELFAAAGSCYLTAYNRTTAAAAPINIDASAISLQLGSVTQASVVSGGINASTRFEVGGTKVIGAQGAAVADATDAGSAITQLNALLARCRAHGLIAT